MLFGVRRVANVLFYFNSEVLKAKKRYETGLDKLASAQSQVTNFIALIGKEIHIDLIPRKSSFEVINSSTSLFRCT